MNKKNIIFILTILVIAGVIGSYLYFSKKIDNGQDVVCTMEALLCPDGSYVGRTVPKCGFSKCPDKSPIIGILRQSGDGFDLLMDSPETDGMDVSYVMPITLKVSNVIGQLVGKKVSVFGYFTEGNEFYVERLEELKDSDRTLGEVGVGEVVYVNGVRITLNKVIQDSRCPIGVQCIQAGAITANITLQSSTDKETKNIASDEPPILFDSYKISIEKINPPRLSDSEPDLKSYRLNFRVISN